MKGKPGVVTILLGLTWLVTGCWIYFNTHVVNELQTDVKTEKKQVAYETDFSMHRNTPQPRVVDIRYNVEIYPERRTIKLNGVQTIKNRTRSPIKNLLVSLMDGFESRVEVEGATMEDSSARNRFLVFRFASPLAPGAETTMSFTVNYEAKGFENEVTMLEIVENGTFFNNDIVPQIGYQPWLQLDDKNKRRKYGLEEIASMNKLDPDNLDARAEHLYLQQQ